MMRQGKFAADARIQNPQLDCAASFSGGCGGCAGGLAERPAARRCSRPRARAAVGRRQALRDQRDQLTRDLELRSARDLDLAARPEHGERIVLAIEGEPFADLVGGDHVELLALEFGARIFLDVVRLRREADDERPLRHVRHRLDDIGRGLEIELDASRRVS